MTTTFLKQGDQETFEDYMSGSYKRTLEGMLGEETKIGTTPQGTKRFRMPVIFMEPLAHFERKPLSKNISERKPENCRVDVIALSQEMYKASIASEDDEITIIGDAGIPDVRKQIRGVFEKSVCQLEKANEKIVSATEFIEAANEEKEKKGKGQYKSKMIETLGKYIKGLCVLHGVFYIRIHEEKRSTIPMPDYVANGTNPEKKTQWEKKAGHYLDLFQLPKANLDKGNSYTPKDIERLEYAEAGISSMTLGYLDCEVRLVRDKYYIDIIRIVVVAGSPNTPPDLEQFGGVSADEVDMPWDDE